MIKPPKRISILLCLLFASVSFGQEWWEDGDDDANWLDPIEVDGSECYEDSWWLDECCYELWWECPGGSEYLGYYCDCDPDFWGEEEEEETEDNGDDGGSSGPDEEQCEKVGLTSEDYVENMELSVEYREDPNIDYDKLDSDERRANKLMIDNFKVMAAVADAEKAEFCQVVVSWYDPDDPSVKRFAITPLQEAGKNSVSPADFEASIDAFREAEFDDDEYVVLFEEAFMHAHPKERSGVFSGWYQRSSGVGEGWGDEGVALDKNKPVYTTRGVNYLERIDPEDGLQRVVVDAPPHDEAFTTKFKDGVPPSEKPGFIDWLKECFQ